MSKTVLLDGRYKIGGGLGNWAESRERGVRVGDVRLIGGMLMHAWMIHRQPRSLIAGPLRTMFCKPLVWWTPVDTDKKLLYPDLKAWVDSL